MMNLCRIKKQHRQKNKTQITVRILMGKLERGIFKEGELEEKVGKKRTSFAVFITNVRKAPQGRFQ